MITFMIFFLNYGHIFYVNTKTYIKTNTKLNDIGLTGAFKSITLFCLQLFFMLVFIKTMPRIKKWKTIQLTIAQFIVCVLYISTDENRKR